MILFTKFQNISLEKKSAIVFVLATAITSGLQMLTTPLFTRLMPVDSFGIVQLYNTWYQVICVFATFSVTNAVVNVGFHKFPKDRMGYLSSSLGFSSICTIIFIVLIIILKPWFESISSINTPLIILMALSFFLLHSTQLWICLSRYELKYKVVFWVVTISATSASILSLIAVYYTNDHFAEVRLWSQNIIPLMVGLVLYIYIIKKGKKFYNKQYWHFIFSFNAPLLIHYLSQFVLSSSDRLMISYYTNKADVAIYSLAYLVSNILMVFFSPINSVIIPRTHKLMDDKNYHEVEKFLYKLIFLIGGIIFFISISSPEIISILGGERYKEGIKIVPIVSASTLFTVLYLYVANIEFMFGKTSRIAYMTIIAAVINIVLNFVFIPIFGFAAAAYTTLIAYAIYAWLHIYNMNKLVGSNILSNSKLLIICSLIVGSCFLTVTLAEYNIVRYSIICLAIMSVVLNAKKIKKLIM